MSDFKEIYFTRTLLSAVIEQTWVDVINFTKYKNPYKQEEADKARIDALMWLHSQEFEQWCGALGIEHDSILEELKKRYAVQKMRRRDKGCDLCESRDNDVPDASVSGVPGEDGDEGNCDNSSEVGMVEQGSQAEAEAEAEKEN
jgi:hypothetical protein